MSAHVTRKFTREEAESSLRYLHEVYGVAPAYLSHYLYLVELERALGASRRLPSQSIINKYWPNVRDAWLSLEIEPAYDLSDLDTGFAPKDEIDEEIRRLYEQYPLRPDRWPALHFLAEECDMPAPALALRAAQIGLENHTRIEWTEEELAVLETCAHLSKHQIARALELRGFTRSHQAMPIILARRAQLNSTAPTHYSLQQLSGFFGLDSHCVKRWLDLGLLKFEMKGTVRTRQQGGDTSLVRRADVREFVRIYPELYDLRKVNQPWFISLLREGKRAADYTKSGQAQVKTRAATIEELPEEYECKQCHHTKPRLEMVVVFIRREKIYRMRALCKECHNERERGHRREWKRNYLRQWREKNAERNENYWKGNARVREQNRVNAARRTEKHHEALLIQGRLKRKGVTVDLDEAEALLKRFGRCYPSRLGLTEEGLRECERIRSRARRPGAKKLTPIEIRICVYEKGFFIPPEEQPKPYQTAANRLSEWQQKRREKAA